MNCQICTGPLVPLGDLGNMKWFRCRNCGSEEGQLNREPQEPPLPAPEPHDPDSPFTLSTIDPLGASYGPQ